MNLYVVGEEGQRKQEHKAYTFPRNIWDLEILSAVSQPMLTSVQLHTSTV